LRANALVLGEARFKVAKRDTSVSKHYDKGWMIRTPVKRRGKTVRVRSNQEGRRFDGGVNYPIRRVAAQRAEV